MKRKVIVENVNSGEIFQVRVKKGSKIIAGPKDLVKRGSKASISLGAGEVVQVRRISKATGRLLGNKRWTTVAKNVSTVRKKRKKKTSKKKTAKKKPAKKKSKKTRKKKPGRKREKPPKEWLYYKVETIKKRSPKTRKPTAAAASIWWKLKKSTKAKIIKVKNTHRAKDRIPVITSRGALSRRAVESFVGKPAAKRIYKKLKLSKAEIAAAKKAIEK